MEGKYRVKDGCLTVAMPKELDHHSALGLKAETDMLIGAYHVRRLVFDFSETEFMDSSGIGVIMGRYQKLRLLGGSVAVTHVSDRIWRILHLAGVTKVLEVEKERNWKESK